MKDRNTIYKLIFILSIAFTGIVIVTVVLYIISLLIALFMVKPTAKALEAKKNKAA